MRATGREEALFPSTGFALGLMLNENDDDDADDGFDDEERKKERGLIFLAHASTQASTRVELSIRINLSHQDNHEGQVCGGRSCSGGSDYTTMWLVSREPTVVQLVHLEWCTCVHVCL